MRLGIRYCSVALGLAALMAVLLAGPLRAGDAPRYNVSLEAQPRSAEVDAGMLMLVDLKLTNIGQHKIVFDYSRPVERLPIMREGLRFDLIRDGQIVPPYRPRDRRMSAGGGLGYIQALDPGQSVTAIGCVNWDCALDTAGEYIATATMTLGVNFTVESDPFAFTVTSVAENVRTAKIREAEAILLKKVTFGPQAVEALLVLAFCGTPESVAKLTSIMISHPRFVTHSNVSRAALRVALDRLQDSKQALANAHALLKAADPNLKREGVDVIYTRGTPDDAGALVALLDDADYMVRWDACGALKKVADSPVEPKSEGAERLADVVKQAKTWWANRTPEK